MGRPFVSGHNRLYHYSTTCLPIPSHAILHGENEEDHPDPEWLRIKTSKMIDDFTDVNAGEKEFMKMWNNHVQKYTYVGDCQMPQALSMFIDIRGQDIVQKNLFRNFSLHLVNLFEFGVIGPSCIYSNIKAAGPGSQSWPPARPLLGQPPALPDSSDDKFSPEQEVCQDEEEFCRNFHQIHMKLD